jgi:hypothetical protein
MASRLDSSPGSGTVATLICIIGSAEAAVQEAAPDRPCGQLSLSPNRGKAARRACQGVH